MYIIPLKKRDLDLEGRFSNATKTKKQDRKQNNLSSMFNANLIINFNETFIQRLIIARNV